jgi:ATP-dependent DNA ligase
MRWSAAKTAPRRCTSAGARATILINAGKTGAGFANAMVLQLSRLLKPITVDKMSLVKKPNRKNKIDHWATPKYWAEVE